MSIHVSDRNVLIQCTRPTLGPQRPVQRSIPMRVHYLSTSTIPSRAANAVHVMKICAAMVRLGHEPTLFSRGGTDASADAIFHEYGITDVFDLERVRTGRIPLVSSLRYAWRCRQRSKDFGIPDVYWARQVQSLLAVRDLGAPLVYEVHGLFPSRYHRALERLLIRSPNLSHVVVISDALRNDFLEVHPELAASRVLVAHDGADPVAEPSGPVTPWPGRSGVVQVGYTGHLYEGRGVDAMIELARRMPQLDFHLVGGTDHDVERWQRSIERRGRLENLWFHGHQPAARMGSYLARFDIALAPYQHHVRSSRGDDTARWVSPMKIFEYMAAGKAIVASTLPTICEVLTDDTDALLREPDNIDAWHAAVERLATDRDLRGRLGRAARQRLEACYTWTARAEAVLDRAERGM